MKMLKQILILCLSVVISASICGCASSQIMQGNPENNQSSNNEDGLITDVTYESEDDLNWTDENLDFSVPFDPSSEEFSNEYKYAVSQELDAELAKHGLFIQDINTAYVSKELIEERQFNAQKNVYFGYHYEDLMSEDGQTVYICKVNEDGQTVVAEYDEYQEPYDQILQDTCIGTGVIIATYAIGSMTQPYLPAISVILCASGKGALIGGAFGAISGGAVSWIIQGIETGNWDFNAEIAADAAAGYKIAAISGAVTKGTETAKYLKALAKQTGMNWDDVAKISRDKSLQLTTEMIQNLHSVKEFDLYKKFGLEEQLVNGKSSLIPEIDWKQLDSEGRTNWMRCNSGLAPLDKNGIAYEVHHIGQKNDSPFALLTRSQHIGAENKCILHICDASFHSEVEHGAQFAKEKREFFRALAAAAGYCEIIKSWSSAYRNPAFYCFK